MSVITIAKKDGLCAMAADTLTTQGGRRIAANAKVRASKILRFDGTFLGFVGYSAHGIVFEDLIWKHGKKLDFGGRRAIFDTAYRIHDILTDDYHLRTEESNSDQPYDSSQLTFAIANAHGIFTVDSYREVFQFSEFWSIGSGSSYALGAMRVLYDQEDANAEFIAREGAMTAAAFNVYCAEPIESFAVHHGTKINAEPTYQI